MSARSHLGFAIAGSKRRLTAGSSSALSSRPRAFPALPVRAAAFDRPSADRRSCSSKTRPVAVASLRPSPVIAARTRASLAYGPCPAYTGAPSDGASASDTARATPAKPCASAPSTPDSSRISPVCLSQQRGTSRVLYEVVGEGDVVRRVTTSADGARGSEEDGFFQRGVALFYKIFLPTYFPASVTSNYLRFTGAMTMQIFLGNVSRVLATQAMLMALGFGSQTALPFAAVTAWILKDGLGHLGAIAVGTVINRRFDSDPKRFRFFAAVIGKVADVLSIFTLGWPHYFLALSTLGSTCGRISAGTALNCRAKVYETFALDSNLGDVMRCAQAQSTAAQLLGTGIGVLIGPAIGCDMVRLLMVNIVFSSATLFCSYFASAEVRMTCFNLQRAEMVFHKVILDILSSELDSQRVSGSDSLTGDHVANASLREDAQLEVLSTHEVQAAEVFVSQYHSVFDVPLAVNPPMLDGHSPFTPSSGYLEAKHILAVEPRTDAKPEAVALWVREGAAPPEVLRAFFQACILRVLLTQSTSETLLPGLHARSEVVVGRSWPQVQAALSRGGWRTDVVSLDTKDGRLRID